jgi:hypothetical protein
MSTPGITFFRFGGLERSEVDVGVDVRFDDADKPRRNLDRIHNIDIPEIAIQTVAARR